jgi:hypothetical protein
LRAAERWCYFTMSKDTRGTVTTHRGDLHLTQGIPQVLASYEQVTEVTHLNHLVVDREAMAADFLAQLSTEGRTTMTIRKYEPIQRAR